MSVVVYVSGVVTGVVSDVVFGSAVVSVVVMLALVVLSCFIDVPSLSASVFVDCSIVDVRYGCGGVVVVAVVVGSSVKSMISSGEAVVPVWAKNNTLI